MNQKLTEVCYIFPLKGTKDIQEIEKIQNTIFNENKCLQVITKEEFEKTLGEEEKNGEFSIKLWEKVELCQAEYTTEEDVIEISFYLPYELEEENVKNLIYVFNKVAQFHNPAVSCNKVYIQEDYRFVKESMLELN